MKIVPFILVSCLALLAPISHGDTAAQLPSLPEGLRTVEFFSPAVQRTMKYDIVLPADYADSDSHYPVIYLLHGNMQNYTVWGRHLGAAMHARRLGGVILVMPDAGNSWYVNYASSVDGEHNYWEDYLIEDVIPHVDSQFRTLAQREGRAIAGLSMGGYGAFMLGLRHPHLFASVGSSSGALGFARDRAAALAQGQKPALPRSDDERRRAMAEAEAVVVPQIGIEGFSYQHERTPQGIHFETEAQARAYDPFDLLYRTPKSQLPHFYLDCGTEDSLMSVTREFMQILLFNDVPFDFMQGRGGHNAGYWRQSVGHLMAVQYEILQRELGRR